MIERAQQSASVTPRLEMDGSSTSSDYHRGWDRWIAENSLRGVSRQTLQTQLIRKGFPPSLVEQCLDELLGHPVFKAAQEYCDRHHKLSSLLTTLSHLQDGSHASEEVDVVPALEGKRFYADYVRRNRPVLAKGLIRHWPAVSKWSGRYFLECVGNVAVAVSAERETDTRFEENFKAHVRTMCLAEFVDLVESTVGNNVYLCAKHDFLCLKGAEKLTDDFDYPAGFMNESVAKSWAGLWLGPKGTWTPFHHDGCNQLFCQVRGSKQVHLVAPVHLPRLYNKRECFSDVDPRRVDFDRYPEMRGVPIQTVIVEEGDALLIPVGWWHSVEALTTSISLTLANLRVPANAHIWSWRRAGPEPDPSTEPDLDNAP